MAAITSAVIGTGLAAYTAIDAAKKREQAQDALNDYDRQELNNAYENVQLNNAAADYRREQGDLAQANLIDAARGGGMRSIFGNVPRINAFSNNLNREISADLADQNTRRQYAIAGDNARIEGITENRDIANINALSSQVDASNQDFYNGLTGAATGLASGIQAADAQGFFNKKRPKDLEPVEIDMAGAYSNGFGDISAPSMRNIYDPSSSGRYIGQQLSNYQF